MGVNELPTFAATVCRTMVSMIGLASPSILNTTRVNGTNVINATSLVIHMEAKKVNPTNRIETRRTEWTWASRSTDNRSNNPIDRNPATTAINAKRHPSTLKSI